jgi:hypothetical protein
MNATDSDIDNEGRCEAMTLPSYADDLPPYRCTRVAVAERKGRAVCAAHSRKLSIQYFDAEPR